MSRKRKAPPKTAAVEAVPEDVLAEGSGPVQAIAWVGIDAIAGSDESEPFVEHAAEAAPAATDAPTEMLATEDVVGDDVVGDPIMTASTDEVSAEGADVGGDDVVGEPITEDPAAVLPTSAATLEPAQLKLLVEALVFASDKPITIVRLRQLTRVSDTRRLEDALTELAADYTERGLILQQVSGGYQFRTRTQWSPWVQQLIAGRPVRLTRAQLETLAIIAYRQPITRPEIDDIRGVDSSATLKLLIDRSLIRILGKKEEAGRPMLYGTTKEFLDFFSLGDLRELPTLREYSELTDESRQLVTDRLGPTDDGDDNGSTGGTNGGGPDGGGPDGGGPDGGGPDGGGTSGEPTGDPGLGAAPPETAADLIARYVAELEAAAPGVVEADGLISPITPDIAPCLEVSASEAVHVYDALADVEGAHLELDDEPDLLDASDAIRVVATETAMLRAPMISPDEIVVDAITGLDAIDPDLASITPFVTAEGSGAIPAIEQEIDASWPEGSGGTLAAAADVHLGNVDDVADSEAALDAAADALSHNELAHDEPSIEPAD